ncbi:MAG: hypothetical protein OJJ54_22275 [Pseudonocardia sp.]|nr:hypothetical protein [Pseudonocardia sp.]
MATTLSRRLGTADAAVLGLSAVFGAGIFAVFAPAAAVAGPWLLASVLLAAAVAGCSAASSADLATARDARAVGDGVPEGDPDSHDVGYDAARRSLHPAIGRLAGVAHLTGKIAVAAAAAGIFGTYVLPTRPLVVAIVVIAVMTGLNIVGVRPAPRAAWSLVGGIGAVLLVVVVVGLLGPGGAGTPSVSAATEQPVTMAPGLLPITRELGLFTGAGLVFFGFAGFSRIIGLGTELRTPSRTRARALAIVIGIATAAYLAVCGALLVGLGTDRLAVERSPLVALVDTGRAPALGVLVRIGAAVAAGSTLLAVLAAAAVAAAAMASRGDLPAVMARRCGSGAAWRADIAGMALAILVVVFAGTWGAIALTACALLVDFAVVNLAALRLPRAGRTWRMWLAGLGVVLCGVLALSMPPITVLITACALAGGWLLTTAVSVRSRRTDPVEHRAATPDPPDEQAA